MALPAPTLLQSGLTAVVLGCDTELGIHLLNQLVSAPFIHRIFALSEIETSASATFVTSPAHAAKLVSIVRPYAALDGVLAELAPQLFRVVAFSCLAVRPDAVESMREFHELNFVYPTRFAAAVLRLDLLKLTLQSHANADMEETWASQHAQACAAMEEEVMELFQEDLYQRSLLFRRFEPGIAFFQTPTLISEDISRRGRMRRRMQTREKISRRALAKQKFAVRFNMSSEFAIRVSDVAQAMLVDMHEFIFLMESVDPMVRRSAVHLVLAQVEAEEMEDLADEKYKHETLIPDAERLERRMRSRYLDDWDEEGGFDREMRRAIPPDLRTPMLPGGGPGASLPPPGGYLALPMPPLGASPAMVNPMAMGMHGPPRRFMEYPVGNQSIYSRPGVDGRLGSTMHQERPGYGTFGPAQSVTMGPAFGAAQYRPEMMGLMQENYGAVDDRVPYYAFPAPFMAGGSGRFGYGAATPQPVGADQYPHIEEVNEDENGNEVPETEPIQRPTAAAVQTTADEHTAVIPSVPAGEPVGPVGRVPDLQPGVMPVSEFGPIADGFETTGDALEAAVARIGPNIPRRQPWTTNMFAMNPDEAAIPPGRGALPGQPAAGFIEYGVVPSRRQARKQIHDSRKEASMYSPPTSVSETSVSDEEDDFDDETRLQSAAGHTRHQSQHHRQGGRTRRRKSGRFPSVLAALDPSTALGSRRADAGHSRGNVGDRRHGRHHEHNEGGANDSNDASGNDADEGQGGLRARLRNLATKIMGEPHRNTFDPQIQQTPSVAI